MRLGPGWVGQGEWTCKWRWVAWLGSTGRVWRVLTCALASVVTEGTSELDPRPLMRRRSYSGGEQECERGSRMDSTPRREVRGDGVGKSGPRRAAPQVNLLIKRPSLLRVRYDKT